MNCEYNEKTILYFYGELPAASLAEVRVHLGVCPSCAAALSVLKGLSEDLNAFRPRPPELDIETIASGSYSAPAERLFPGFMRRVLAGALAAVFLAVFHLSPLKVAQHSWHSDIDARLESVESRIYTLEDEMVCPVYADFDYAYSDLETRKERADGQV